MSRSMTTLSVIKADVGGFVGHTSVHPRLVEVAEGELGRARGGGVLEDFRVLCCGDDLELIMTHRHGADAKRVHGLAWEVFARSRANEIADYLRRHGPFEPHRLPEEDMEYTTLPRVLEKLKPSRKAERAPPALAGARK